MKTTHFFSLAAIFAALTLAFFLSSCGTVGDGGDNSGNSQQGAAEPSSSSESPPPPSSAYIPPPSSSSSGNVTRCGNTMFGYDPATQFCVGNLIYDKCGGKEYNPETQGCSSDNKVLTRCGGTTYGYDPATQFCVGNSIYNKCGGKEYNPTTQVCSNNTVLSKCGIFGYEPSTHFCSGNTVYAKCGGKEYNPATQECTNNILYSSLTDSRDSKKYKTVDIGTQTWMTENLNYAANGSKCPNNDTPNCTKYGRQYNWLTATTVCPTG